jgi:phosphatidylserine decarboxylase
MLKIFNRLLDKPPRYGENIMIALPFTVILEWRMATKAGLAAFLQKKLNTKLGNRLTVWGKYLMTKDSARVLTKDSDGWLSPGARKIMQDNDPKHRKFEEMYQCEPEEPYLGFQSWDDFFTRRFRSGVRLVEEPNNDHIINSGCESAPYAIKQKVKLTEEFWL